MRDAFAFVLIEFVLIEFGAPRVPGQNVIFIERTVVDCADCSTLIGPSGDKNASTR
jgi:hypothetical protein